MENIHVLDKLPSVLSYSAAGLSPLLMNQQYKLHKVSLNRNIHKTRLCINWLRKMWPEAPRNQPCISPRVNDLVLANSVF